MGRHALRGPRTRGPAGSRLTPAVASFIKAARTLLSRTTPELSYVPWRHRYTLLVATATVALLGAGGLVTSTGSGLAAPDWPLSFGKVSPPMEGGVLFEHGHRMVATTVGLLSVGLAFWYQRREERRPVRRAAWLALAAVVLQGL